MTRCLSLWPSVFSLGIYFLDDTMSRVLSPCFGIWQNGGHLDDFRGQNLSLAAKSSPPNTLELLSLTIWNGVNMLLKFLLKQLRLWVFFGAIWHLHLGIQRKLHTKHWFALSSSMQLLFGIPIMKLRQKRWRKCRRQQPGGSAGDGIMPVASKTCLMNLSGHPWRTAG